MSQALIKLWYQRLLTVHHVSDHPLRIKSDLLRPLTSLTSSQQLYTQVGTFGPPLMERPAKRVRLSPDPAREDETIPSGVSTPLASLHRSITPPSRARSQPRAVPDPSCPDLKSDKVESSETPLSGKRNLRIPPRIISSPVQLTHIQDFPQQKGYNVDTVKLRDILGDPMVRECWQFNYLFDVDFLMSNFDEDVRGLVKVKVVHGSWERESANRLRVEVSIMRLSPNEHQYLPGNTG